MISHHDVAVVIAGAADWLQLGLETLGAIVIAVGALTAAQTLAIAGLRGRVESSFTVARMTLARWLALALEFQLAADVLETAISPNWTKIGQVAAIATIRTTLNYFLSRESRELQQASREPEQEPQRAAIQKIAAR